MAIRGVRSNEPIPEALLDATERIWATERPSAITMRRIAEEANVSLGLAYNFVQSKEDLFGATLERMARRLSAAASAAEPGSDMLNALWAEMDANPGFERLMTWLVLEGVNVSRVMAEHPVVEDLAEHFRDAGAQEPDLAGGVTAFFGISVRMFEVLMNRVMGRPEMDPSLRAAVAGMYAHWLEATVPESS